MTYSDSTPDNAAVQSLVEGFSARVRSLGAALIPAHSGTYTVQLTVGARTDSASTLVRIYDTGNDASGASVVIATNSATITDDGGSITATSLVSTLQGSAYRCSWIVVLTAPTGDWAIEISTNETTSAVPMDFSGFELTEAAVIATIVDKSVTNAKLRDSAGLSFIGRSANTAGVPADIIGTDGQVARVSGTTFGFGTIVAAGIASDAVTTAKILDGNVTVAKTAVLSFNAQTGTTFTPAVTDLDNVVTLSNAAAITVTLPQDSDVAYPIGRSFVAMWLGAGQPTFAAGTGATVNASGGLLAINAQYDMVSVLKRAANTWVIAGPRA